MTFEQAMHDTCRELGYVGHIKTIKYKKDASTYAERIAVTFGVPKAVMKSYMYLVSVDFCFYQNGDDVDFAISGRISRNDKLNIVRAINRALEICRVCEEKLKAEAIDEYTEWLRKSHANFNEDYAEDIKSDYLEWLKEQKNDNR